MPVTRTDKFRTTLKKVLIAFSILCLLGLTTFAFVNRSKRPVALLKDSSGPEARLMLPAGPPTQQPVELVTLEPGGFEPAELTRPAGRFLFGVNNRSGVSDLTFWLMHESGASRGERHIVKEKVWRLVLDLPPGHYVLGVTDHPNWRCPITITNQ
jgi:hypothetical protein